MVRLVVVESQLTQEACKYMLPFVEDALSADFEIDQDEFASVLAGDLEENGLVKESNSSLMLLIKGFMCGIKCKMEENNNGQTDRTESRTEDKIHEQTL